jgi:hypothetical protein
MNQKKNHYLGLLEEGKFYKLFILSNQRSSSVIEFKNNKS